MTYIVGVDYGSADNKSVMTIAKRRADGTILIVDEYSEFQWPKWYRHPILAFRLWRTMRRYWKYWSWK